ncbi:MAG: VOC family protein [Firmicutes bacterium]|nr:VOC family protein [Bacillota bacterium]
MHIPHITISTVCAEESIQFYTRYCGLAVKTARGILTFMGNADEENDTLIELVAVEENGFCGSGISIGFEVEDAEAYHQKLEEEGLSPTPLKCPSPSTKFFYVTDPNGVRIQFIQH